MEEPLTKESVLEQINRVKEQLQKSTETLPDTIYGGMMGISDTLFAYKDGAGHPGWTKNLKGGWTPDQKAMLEEFVPKLVDTRPTGPTQAGGGRLRKLTLKLPVDGNAVKPANPMLLTDISLDKAYYGIKNFLQDLDNKTRMLAREVGPVAYINKKYAEDDPGLPPKPPYLPFPIKFPARAILPLLNAVLESLRLFVSISVFNTDYDNQILRQILSVSLAIFDLSRGEWKDSLLSLLGVYSRNALLSGFVLKTARWVYNFISPDIQEDIEDSLYAGTKSMFVGGWLWVFSTVSPAQGRIFLTDMFNTLGAVVADIEGTMADLEKEAQMKLALQGAKVRFPRISDKVVPTFEDIQNLQALLHYPPVYCSEPFKKKILPQALGIPPMRIFFELLNIPTLPEKIAEHCKDIPDSFGKGVAAAQKPQVVLPEPITERDQEEFKESEEPTEQADSKEESQEPKEEPKESNEEPKENQTFSMNNPLKALKKQKVPNPRKALTKTKRNKLRGGRRTRTSRLPQSVLPRVHE